MSEEIVVVVTSGERPRPEAVLAIPLGATVIAADGGLDHASALGLDVVAAIGDLDSVSTHSLAVAESEGIQIERHPAEKDATDLELALEAALARGPSRILVLGGLGDRLDHLLGALLLLGSAKWAGVEIDAEIGPARVHVIRDERTLTGRPGELVSLLALHGPAEAVRTAGLLYELRGETLEPGSSRGVSNAFTTDTAHVSLDSGVLLAVRPHPDPNEAESGSWL